MHVNVNFCDFFHRYVLCFTPNDVFASFFYIFKLKSKANSLMPRYVFCGIQDLGFKGSPSYPVLETV